MIDIWGLYWDNQYFIFDLHNKFFEVGFTNDGRFDPCVVYGIVMFVQFYVLYSDMSHDVDGRQIGARGIALP